jgi:putative sigma-54 modulation protein
LRTIVKGKNLAVPEDDRRYTHRKLRRLERLLDDRTDALVELSTESHRAAQDSCIVEVTLVIDGKPLHAAANAANHRAAVDEVVDKLERQAVSLKGRPLSQRRTQVRRQTGAEPSAAPDEAHEPHIVVTKRFAIEPMFEEDAVSWMEELGHSFFIFVNAANERLGVLYRRSDGNYGLIEPIIAGEYTTGRER